MDRDSEHALQRELDRVVDRLNSLPLTRTAEATTPCREAAERILTETRLLTDDIPQDAVVPDLGPQGLGSMIAVLGRDYLDAARASSDADIGPVLDALVSLRRALP